LHDIEEGPALARLERFQQHYAMLVEDVFEELRASVRVLPGVHDLLDALDAAGAIQSLLTGNLRPTAELKLRAAGLAERFDFEIGAFGSDHRNRDELVPIARAKTTTRFGRPDTVVVIGDTPRDIACGKAGAARTIAVATGAWNADALREHGPDAVLRDLADTQAALRAILRS
jgi:phosphoglycolate phosphatase-like HAD superfamily hydrolase